MHVSVAVISSPRVVTMLWTDYHYITASALPHLSCLADEPSRGVVYCCLGGEETRFFPFLAARTGFHSVHQRALCFCAFCLLPFRFDGVLYQLRMYEYLAHVSYTYTECMLCKSPATYTPPFFPSVCYSCLFIFPSQFPHHSPRFHPHHQQKPWNLSPVHQSARAFSLSGA